MFRAAVQGRTLRFRLVGINNQNFVMQDEETGSWWQQVTGEAIFGPLRGARLELRAARRGVVRDLEGRASRRPGAAARSRRSSGRPSTPPADWDERMTTTPTVTALPADSPLPARTLVVGVEVTASSKAYPLDRVREARALVDTVGGVPIVVVVAEDGRSVRAFDRRVDGAESRVRAGARHRPAGARRPR